MPYNRAVLLDFLSNQCEMFHFRRETFYLCQSYVDIFMDRKMINIDDLHLLGVTCLMIAMKMEEVDLVPLRDILRQSGMGQDDMSRTIQCAELMEREVLTIL